jgi:regulatory protein
VTSKKLDSLRGRGAAAIDPLDSRAARVAALDFLARRDRSSGDLRRKLVDKGYDTATASAVIERLCGEKLIDDQRYVENFVSFHAARGQGPIRVRAELRQLGLEGEMVEVAVAAYPDWLGQLRAARQKKFGTQPPSLYADTQRQARFLGYRGFTGAQIRLALGLDTDLDIETTL